MNRRTLAVFVRRPRPGEVKTRLAAELGAGAAAELYRTLAQEVVRRTAPRPGDYDRTFFYAPADAGPEMEAWLPGGRWRPQEGEDLGARMVAAFRSAFADGAGRVAVVGSDVPSVSRAAIVEAFEALGSVDVVLGPALDGGYWLIALGLARPELFDGIAWGTGEVFEATVERAAALGLSVGLLDARRDVDTLADVRAEWGQLRALLEGQPALMATVEAAVTGSARP